MIGFMQIPVDDIVDEGAVDDEIILEEIPKEVQRSLVLNEPGAISQSDRQRRELVLSPLKDFSIDDYQITFEQSLIEERHEQRLKLLQGEIIQTNVSESKKQVKIGLDLNLKVTLNGNDIEAKTIKNWEKILSDIFDKQTKDIDERKVFLKNKGLLELFTMFDVNDDNIISLKSDGSIERVLLNAFLRTDPTNKIERYKKLELLFSEDQFDANKGKMKQIFIAMFTPLMVQDTNNNYIGYIHTLSYLLNPNSSVSLHNNMPFREPTEQLNAELAFVMDYYNFRLKLYNEVKEVKNNESVIKEMTIPSSNSSETTVGKLNVLEEQIYYPSAMMLPNHKEFYQLAYNDAIGGDEKRFILRKFKVNNNDNIVVKDIYNEIYLSNYLFGVLIPMLMKIKNKETANDIYEELLKIIQEVDSKFNKDSGKSTISNIYDYYSDKLKQNTDKSSISEFNEIENKILTLAKFSSEEDNIYRSFLNNYMYAGVRNPMIYDSKIQLYVIQTVKMSDLVLDESMIEEKIKDEKLQKNIIKKLKKIGTYKEKVIKQLNENLAKLLSNKKINNNINVKKDQFNIITFLRLMFKVKVNTISKDFDKVNPINYVRTQLKDKTEFGSFYVVKENDKPISSYRLFIGLVINNKKRVIEITFENNLIKYQEYDTKNKATGITEQQEINDILSGIYLSISPTFDKFYDNEINISSLDVLKLITNTRLIGVNDIFYINPIIKIDDTSEPNTEQPTVPTNDVFIDGKEYLDLKIISNVSVIDILTHNDIDMDELIAPIQNISNKHEKSVFSDLTNKLIELYNYIQDDDLTNNEKNEYFENIVELIKEINNNNC